MSPCSQGGHTALTFISYYLEEMGQMIRNVLVGCYFYTSMSLSVGIIISFSSFQETSCCRQRWYNGISVCFKIFRVKEDFTYDAVMEH